MDAVGDPLALGLQQHDSSVCVQKTHHEQTNTRNGPVVIFWAFPLPILMSEIHVPFELQQSNVSEEGDSAMRVT